MSDPQPKQKPTILQKLAFPSIVLIIVFFAFFCFESWLLLSLNISGLLVGLFYGLKNFEIFEYPYTKEYYEKYRPNFRIRIPDLNIYAEINALWVHIVGGLVGANSLFWLSHFRPENLESVSAGSAILITALAFFTVMGYSGLLPRLFWFSASKGNRPF